MSKTTGTTVLTMIFLTVAIANSTYDINHTFCLELKRALCGFLFSYPKHRYH